VTPRRPTTASTRRFVRSRRLLAQAARPAAPRVTQCVSQTEMQTKLKASAVCGVLGVLNLVSCSAPPVSDPPNIQWARDWPNPPPPPPPPPPPGEHDAKLAKLPLPLSVANARRVLTEATIYAPWGFGFEGRPMQALAINVLIEQPQGLDILETVYREANTPGRLLALCGLRATDKRRFILLSAPYRHSTEEVPVYEGCNGWQETTTTIVSRMDTTDVCSGIPTAKERLVAQFK